MRSFSSVCLLAGLLASSAMVVPAFSADVTPASGWAVTRIDGSQSNAGPYCTLSRQYDNGVILTLGRNTTEEYSLAVDFRKDRFDPDRAYKLSLQPGPGQVRAFEMMPISPGAMVVRLGWDETFFSALEKSKNLKVGISGEEYAFAMPDISAGQKDLTACMKGLKTASATDPAKAVAGIAPAAGGTDVLAAEPTQSGEGFSARKVAADEGRPSTKVASAPTPAVVPVVTPVPRAAASPASAGGDHLASALAAEKQKSAQQLSELQVSKNKISELNEKIRLLESGKGIPADMNAGKVASLEKQVAALQADIAAAKAEKDKIAQERDAARAQAAAPKTVDPALQDRISSLTADNQTLKAKLAAAEKIAQQKQDTAKTSVDQDIALTNQMNALREKLAAAEQDAKAKQAALTAAQQNISAKDTELARALKKADKAAAGEGAEITQLKKQLSTVTQQRDTLTTELAARQAALEQARRTLTDVQTKASTSTAVTDNLAETQKKLQEALAEKESMTKTIATLRAEGDRLRDELNGRQPATASAAGGGGAISRLDNVASLRLQIEKLNNQLSLKENESRTYRNQLSALQAQLSDTVTQQQVAAAQAMNATTPAAGHEMAAPEPAPAPLPRKKRVTPTSGYQTALASTLNNAGIVLRTSVQRSGGTGEQEVYHWRTTNLHGRAEITPMPDPAQFNALIAKHVERSKSRCPGDFAAVPSEQRSGETFYEVACVTPSQSTSASILFYADQGRFVAVSHETTADDMDIAMDARDRFASKLRR